MSTPCLPVPSTSHVPSSNDRIANFSGEKKAAGRDDHATSPRNLSGQGKGCCGVIRLPRRSEPRLAGCRQKRLDRCRPRAARRTRDHDMIEVVPRHGEHRGKRLVTRGRKNKHTRTAPDEHIANARHERFHRRHIMGCIHDHAWGVTDDFNAGRQAGRGKTSSDGIETHWKSSRRKHRRRNCGECGVGRLMRADHPQGKHDR